MLVPVLDDPAVGDAEDVDLADRVPLAGGGHAHELVDHRGARVQPDRDAILFRDEILHGEVDIGQGRVDALGGGAELGASVIGEAEGVRDEVGSHELVDRVEPGPGRRPRRRTA